MPERCKVRLSRRLGVTQWQADPDRRERQRRSSPPSALSVRSADPYRVRVSALPFWKRFPDCDLAVCEAGLSNCPAFTRAAMGALGPD